MKKNLFYLALALLYTNGLIAQISGEQLYKPYANPPVVTAENRVLNFAWCGGANNPQIVMADLNGDRRNDLVIYDPGAGPRTFINRSDTPGRPHYVYSPEFQANFPQVLGYLKLEDYNRDGVPDLIHRGFDNVTPLKGYYKDSQLCFRTDTRFEGFEGLRYFTGGSDWVQVYVAPNDLPGMADVDGDGDLDIITYDIYGSTLYWFRNCQMEEYPSQKDSFPICVKDGCWGKTQQLYQRALILGITNCAIIAGACKGCTDTGSGAKTTHSGNTVCLVDFDGDGDFDVFNGNVAFSDIQYTRNGKKELGLTVDSMVAEDTLWGSNGKSAYVAQMPAAYWVDIDNDGKKDLVFTPYSAGAENYKCIVYYRNTGTSTKPNFVYQSDTLFMQDMIDVGSGAAPTFYDYNKDGKPDMFVGSEGYFQPNGTFRASIQYYENTSTTNTPSFILKSRDFMGLSGSNIKGSSLSMGDLDGDGKDDLVIGNTDGTVIFFKNNAATQALQPVWQSPFTLNDQSGTLDVGDNSAPFIYDLDKDGKNDLIVGCLNGRLFYYRNLGNTFFRRSSDTLGGVMIEVGQSSGSTFASPYIGKIDNTGKDYLLVGSADGTIYRYAMEGTKYPRIDSFYSKITVTQRAKPTVADIDGDGKYEMAVGNAVGGIALFKQYYPSDISDVQLANGGVQIYPNPASSLINISWLPSFGSGDVSVSLISVTGQKLYQGTVKAIMESTQIDVSGLPSGTYYCIVRSAEHQASAPVSVIR